MSRLNLTFLDGVTMFGVVTGISGIGAGAAYLYNEFVAGPVVYATSNDAGSPKDPFAVAVQMVAGWGPFALATVMDPHPFWSCAAGGIAFHRVDAIAVRLFGARAATHQGMIRKGETLNEAIARLGGIGNVTSIAPTTSA